MEPLPRLVPAVVLLALVTASCAQLRREPARVVGAVRTAPAEPHVVQTGTASWYGQAHHGKKTASGEVFDMNALTAAHRTLPLGTRVLVTNLGNGRAVEVRINDRGPSVAERIIDVSYAAARALGAAGDGVFRVRIAVLE